jgi:hypothetical protein
MSYRGAGPFWVYRHLYAYDVCVICVICLCACMDNDFTYSRPFLVVVGWSQQWGDTAVIDTVTAKARGWQQMVDLLRAHGTPDEY